MTPETTTVSVVARRWALRDPMSWAFAALGLLAFAGLLGLALMSGAGQNPAQAAAPNAADPPMASFTRDWREGPTWHDGKAEYAVYDAVRVIYGQPRRYQARIYTNFEMADPDTKTKSATGSGRAVFKHHVREDAPTPNYTYHFSTMTYTGVDDLKSLKIDMGSQEDCGATFKQFVNHAGELNWHQFSYFPNEGHRQGRYSPPSNLMYHDALSLILRGFPFGSEHRDQPMPIRLLPDQTDTHLTPHEPVDARLIYRGQETLDLPIGSINAHRVDLEPMGDTFWFHPDGSAPMLHVMVHYQGADGTRYELAEHRRWAYWKF